MIEDGLGFSLVPWKLALERHLGRQVSGLARAETVDWSFGRKRTPVDIRYIRPEEQGIKFAKDDTTIQVQPGSRVPAARTIDDAQGSTRNPYSIAYPGRRGG